MEVDVFVAAADRVVPEDASLRAPQVVASE